MGKQTDQHRRAFALREDLAIALSDQIGSDNRVPPIDNVDEFYRDLAETLIQDGWVDSWPDDSGTE